MKPSEAPPCRNIWRIHSWAMIDLSYLTEEEQEAIRAVLNRDAELKKVEEQRVQNLQKTVSDRFQLRYLTGEWFYETKQLRHQDRIHGCDIIRASMRHTQRPLTIQELCQTVPEKPSFVCSGNKEVFVPPVLCGLLQEPEPGAERSKNQTASESGPDPPKQLLSPTKRKNPFNAEVAGDKRDGEFEQTPAADDNVSELCGLGLKCSEEPRFVLAERTSGKPVLLETVPEDRQAEESDVDVSESTPSHTEDTNSPSHCVPPTTTKESFGISRKEKSDQEEEDKNEKKELIECENLLSRPADPPVDKPVKTAAVRTLHLTALQKTPFIDTVTSADLDHQPEEKETSRAPIPKKRTHLKTLHERGNSTSTAAPAAEEIRHEDKSETETAALHVAQISSDVATHPADTGLPEEDEAPQTGSRFLVDLSNDEGTYRANPVIVCEETDESLAGSVTDVGTDEPEETVVSEDLGAPGPGPSSLSAPAQQERSVSIKELKHFWEKENAGPKIIAVKVKEASSRSSLPQSTPKTSADAREKLDGGKQAPETVATEVKKLSTVSETHRSTSDSGPAECLEASWSPARQHPKPTNHEDDVRRSPSKTCHPKVLPRDSSSAPRSRLEGSPLKTFPIDIHPQTKAAKQQQERTTPKQRRSPSHGAKAAEQGSFSPQSRMFRGNSSKSSNSPKSRHASEETPAGCTHLARSFVPEDYQHYLGPEDKAHDLPFHEEHLSVEIEDLHGAERGRRLSGSSSPERISNPIASLTVRSRIQEASARSSSLPWAGSGSYSERSSSIVSALKRLSSRNTSSARSLENVTTQPDEEKGRNGAREELNLSVDDVSSLPQCERMRSSVSVPAFLQDETDSDGALEPPVGYRRNTCSSTSNISISSGMASMSSVSGSMNSIYPADFPEVEVQGSIQFAVNYIQKLGEFHIFVVLCRGLAVADGKKIRSDPYVKCYLLPDKTKLGKRKTTVKKKTLNPTYNEILRFKVLMEVLKTQNLNVSVWHNDTFGRNSFLGEVELELSDWDFSNTQINEYSLKARVSGQTSPSHLTDSRGQMRVALRFLPQTSHSKRSSRTEAGEVQIWVKDCKNLPPARGIVIDPFVKCAVLPDTSRKSRQKTRVVKRTASPMFNHTMVYDGFRPEDLREACAEITVWDHDRLNSHYIGGLRLGLGTGKSYGVDVTWMDSSPEEAALWRRMLQAHGEWVEDVLPLRMLVMAKNM